MILLLAPIFEETHFNKYRALSLAANKWCSHLLKELSMIENCLVVYHINEPLFPKGKILLKKENHIIFNTSINLMSYLNIPFIRNYSIRKSYISFLDRKINYKNISHVITYNQQLSNVAKYLQGKGIKWTCIYADANISSELESNADNHLYLSDYAYKNSKYKKKFHFEGCIYDLKINNNNKYNKKIFLYSGNIRKENGVDLMIESFKKLNNTDIELWICGKGDYLGFKEKIYSDKRIKYYGMISESQLIDFYNKAFCFINPRLTSSVENLYNFPSKLFDYLSYGKPIISTYTKGMSPIYKNYLIITEDSINKMAESIKSVCEWEKEQFENYSKNIIKFHEENNWGKKIPQLWNLMK